METRFYSILMLSMVLVAGLLTGCASTPSDPSPSTRQEEIQKMTKCANTGDALDSQAARCAVQLAFWARDGWGTPNGQYDKDLMISWLQKAADKGSLFAASRLARLYSLALVTPRKYESDKAIAVMNPAYDRYLAGERDQGWTKANTDKEMAAGLKYRGLAHAQKGHKIAGAQDYCRSYALNPDDIEVQRWMLGGYHYFDKCPEYLSQPSDAPAN